MRCIQLILVGCFLAGCAPHLKYAYEIPRTFGQQADFAAQEPERLAATDHYFVWAYQGKYFVMGKKETSRSFSKNHVLAHGRAVPGLGPYGETVVFEVDENDPGFTGRLEKQYHETPQMLKRWGNEYYVWKYHDRFFVLGDPATNTLFARQKHLPYTKTLFEAGPNGETVIFEVKKGKPDFAETLMERYLEAPKLVTSGGADYFVWRYKNRLYVLGSTKSSLWFETHLFLADSRAYLNAGPRGETVIVENDNGDPALRQRLTSTFFSNKASLSSPAGPGRNP